MITAVSCDACGVRSPGIRLGFDPVQELEPYGWRITRNEIDMPYLACRKCLRAGRRGRITDPDHVSVGFGIAPRFVRVK